MASETRVGLLVGLMFIVAFGLVLSELTSPIPASSSQPQGQITRQNIWTPTVMPILPSRDEVAIAVVEIEIPELPVRPSEKSEQATAGENTFSPLAAALTGSTQKKTSHAKPIRHIVKPGDSLASIATQYYGSESNYKLIYQANRSELADESLLQVGQVLLIPATGTGQDHRQMGLGELAKRFGTQTPKKRSTRVYVVRQGDNLTRIARKVFDDSSPAAIDKLYEANRDKLANPDALQVGLQLKIPS